MIQNTWKDIVSVFKLNENQRRAKQTKKEYMKNEYSAEDYFLVCIIKQVNSPLVLNRSNGHHSKVRFSTLDYVILLNIFAFRANKFP